MRMAMVALMENARIRLYESSWARLVVVGAAVFAGLCAAQIGAAQNVPLISGGVGFFTQTNSGTTGYSPQIQPLVAAPIGNSLLVESRSILVENIEPNGRGGYSHSHFFDLVYLQGDYMAAKHLTVVGGSFMVPFNTYNDRLSPIWISNFQDGPLIAGVGVTGVGTALGGMVSGSAASNDKFNISYNAWFSARSSNYYFTAERAAGWRGSLYLPQSRLEMGVSVDRTLQGTHENFVGTHLWWEPKDTGFRFRSEYGHGEHAQGYWFETDYRTHAHGGPDNWIGRFEPLFRMQQTFRIDNRGSDNLPGVNIQRADFGLDYNLPHEVRILTSYARQFSATGNGNVWETGIVYRFLFPMWKGRAD
jgi:hypothetical protein